MMPSIHEARFTPRARAWFAVGAAVILAIGLILFWLHRQGAARRAVLELPADQRAEVYRHELANFRTLCGAGPRGDALETECRERAEFLLIFPECDANCRALTRLHLDIPRR